MIATDVVWTCYILCWILQLWFYWECHWFPVFPVLIKNKQCAGRLTLCWHQLGSPPGRSGPSRPGDQVWVRLGPGCMTHGGPAPRCGTSALEVERYQLALAGLIPSLWFWSQSPAHRAVLVDGRGCVLLLTGTVITEDNKWPGGDKVMDFIKPIAFVLAPPSSLVVLCQCW